MVARGGKRITPIKNSPLDMRVKQSKMGSLLDGASQPTRTTYQSMIDPTIVARQQGQSEGSEQYEVQVKRIQRKETETD